MTSPRFPFPIANAWYGVCLSDELPPGSVRPLRYFGQDLVVFRTDSGEAKVLDAFCPHLGAHLGWGGLVDGDTIVCPFHGWKFNGEGVCTEVPYATKIPPKASIGCWPSVERNGVILVWYHAGRQPPDFDVPLLSAFNSPSEWLPHRVLRWHIRTRNQEMMENVVDAAHFGHVHRIENPPELQGFETTASTLHLSFFSPPKTKVDVTMYGMGIQVVEEHGGLGSNFEFVHATYITPAEDEYVDVVQLFAVEKGGSEDEARKMHEQYAEIMSENLERDIIIWSHKTYIDPPVLAENDGPIVAFRRWAQRFYDSKN